MYLVSISVPMCLYLIVMQSGVTMYKHIQTKTADKTKTTTTSSAVVAITAATTEQTSDIKNTPGIVNISNRNEFAAHELSRQNSHEDVYGVNKPSQVSSYTNTPSKITNKYREPWEINYDLCPPSLCFANEEQKPKGTSGSVFYNGDIVLDKYSANVIYSNKTSARHRRATTRHPRTWKNAIVPYMYASDIAPSSASVIAEAMRTIERETCIRFKRRRLRDEDYIRYISEPGCWSAVGRVGGEQKVSIGPECERLGIAIHEILHALGFWHEQARPDRDAYIHIIEENIEPKYIPDFKQTNKVLVTSRGFPYDYESVMHYGNKAFTKHGGDTILVIGIGKKLKMTIGQRVALSHIDIAQLRDMYSCFDREATNTYCPKDWIKLGRKCYKFENKQTEDFAGAVTKCDEMRSRLVLPKDATEEANIKQYIKEAYPNVKVWRTGERIVNGSFVWYSGEAGRKTTYTNWNKSYPATYSSFAWLSGTRKRRSHRQGVWIDAFHACPYICEQTTRYKCVPGDFPDGRDYSGKLDHTKDGFTCQKWTSQYPWPHSLLSFPYNGTENKRDGLGDHNFCRNPSADRKDRPWCYTTKSNFKWQYCDVSICINKGNNTLYNRISNEDGNISNGRISYKPFSAKSKNGRTSERGRSGGYTIKKILLRKHSPNVRSSKARNSSKPSFWRRKTDTRRNNSNRARKYKRRSKSKRERRMSKRRSGNSRLSRKALKSKQKSSRYYH